ncbi:MAG: hypothetical protein ABI639_06610 [Thermoanaerobaculia bacterium]
MRIDGASADDYLVTCDIGTFDRERDNDLRPRSVMTDRMSPRRDIPRRVHRAQVENSNVRIKRQRSGGKSTFFKSNHLAIDREAHGSVHKPHKGHRGGGEQSAIGRNDGKKQGRRLVDLKAHRKRRGISTCIRRSCCQQVLSFAVYERS